MLDVMRCQRSAMLQVLSRRAADCLAPETSLALQVWKTLVQEEGARSLFKGAMYPVTTIAMQVWLGHIVVLSRRPLKLLSCSANAIPLLACIAMSARHTAALLTGHACPETSQARHAARLQPCWSPLLFCSTIDGMHCRHAELHGVLLLRSSCKMAVS